MSPQILATEIEAIIAEADAAFLIEIAKVQDRVYAQVVSILKGLELDSEGYILQNANNRKLISKAGDKINEVFNSRLYTDAVQAYVQTIPAIDALNVQYFRTMSDSFRENRQFLKSLQNETITQIERNIMRDGLQSQVIQPLSQIMNQNVNTGGRYAGFLDQLREYIKGTNTVEGRALRYTKTYLSDTLFTYARTYQQSITSDLGLEWYFYSGPIIKTTRPFCRERAGKHFHKKEIESWADLEWQGKKQGTTASSIFVYVAGWNCQHQLIPVATSSVPAEDRQRNY